MTNPMGAENTLSTSDGNSSTPGRLAENTDSSVSASTDKITNRITIKADPGIDTQEMSRFLGMVFNKTTDSYVQICAFTNEGNGKPRPVHFVMNGELVDSRGQTYEATPDNIADAVAQGDRDGILGPRTSSNILEQPNGWYIRMTTMAAMPPTSKERGGASLTSQVIGFWLDGDYGDKGHAAPKKGQLPHPPDADTVREIWTAAGYPEPSVTWWTGGGINGLWMFPAPITIPSGPDGADLFEEIRKASDRWHTHVVRTAKGMGYKHDNTGNLDRIMRLPGSVNRKSDHAYDPKAVYADYTGATYTLDELMNLIPQEVRPARQTGTQSFDGTADGDTPWDAYNSHMWSEGRFRQQLTDDGWSHHSWSGQVENLTHPEKDPRDGQSATFGHNEEAGQPKLFAFSDSSPGLLGVPREEGGFHWQYTDPYHYLAATRHYADETTGAIRDGREALSACASHLKALGFGQTTDWKHTEVQDDGFEAEDTMVQDPSEDEYIKVSDGQGGTYDRPTQATVNAQLARMGAAPDQAADDEGPKVVFRRASSIRVRKTHWLWDTTPENGVPTSGGRIPKDMLTMAAGLPGTGKSQWAIWLSAQITNGLLPGHYYGQPRNVVYFATEDDWERTIAPRLIAAGADLDRIFHAKVRLINAATVQLNIPEHYGILGEWAQENDVALAIFDPLLSHLGGKINANSEAEVRQALEPLVRAAARYEFTVIGLSHFNKNTGDSDPLNRLMGSRGFSALLRAMIAFHKDKDSEDEETTEVRYVLSQSKNNLGRTDMPSYSYTIQSAVVPTEEGDAYVSRFVLGPETDTSVEAQMASSGRSDEDREAAKDCKSWLRGFLTENGGQQGTADIFRMAEKEKYSRSTVYRVKKELKLTSKSVGFGEAKLAMWALPGS